MGLLGNSKVKALLAGFILSLVLLVGIAALGLLAALSALGNPEYANTPLLIIFLDAAAVYIVAFLLDALFAGLLFVGLVVAAVRNASMPRNDRLAGLVRRAERLHPHASSLGLSERVEPTTQDRMDELKEQYVAGEIGEAEFERRMKRLVDDDVSDEEVRRERRRTEREYEY
ncbi:Short C-terminal domain-containing protein [Haladaptatus litoreus]|uniref:Short C-terminal domain-containing protein n=1 Tax=Haladaptatus litoreus TaxID=553468 RepID=A0A1N6VQN3_9EURY|nr:SHOCT domain-containing protein [Haladaptatus litoreus]SIQ80127.1 Short C-terminal domain-containing protein [Haladaptatus litoreus]